MNTDTVAIPIDAARAAGRLDAYRGSAIHETATHLIVPRGDWRRIQAAQSKPSRLATAGQVLRRAAHAAKSVAKTRVLRIDRASDALYASRLDTCEHCPGDHATRNKDGTLNTCGPMVESMKRAGKGTCGCVLREKARDVKEECPFGYWPKVSLPVISE